MAVHLSTAVRALPGIGVSADADFAHLDIRNVRDLLLRAPFRYDDFSITKPIPKLRHDDTVTIVGTVKSISTRPSKNNRHLKLTEAVVENETGELKAMWFNQPYLERTLRPGTAVALAGRVDRKFGGTMLVNPVHEPAEARVHTGRIVPVYRLSGTLTHRRVRQAVDAALEALDELLEWLPSTVLEAESLTDLQTTIRMLHAPASMREVAQAVERMKFDEIFLHQLLFARVRRDRARASAVSVPHDLEALRSFVASLPFPLTEAQRRAAWEIVQDLGKDKPMNRLLQGDVGAGKTVVAAMAADVTRHARAQTAYLAPTEILAQQQYRTLSSLLGKDEVALLTSSSAIARGETISRTEIVKQLSQGEISVIVGTHALIQPDVQFHSLALVVIDEQQRFGVEQRHALLTRDRGGFVPHLLSMTATPIPRSLALTLWGDLELSILNERPKGRKPILTELIAPTAHRNLHTRLQTEIAGGHQAFVVCPLIDPEDGGGEQSVHEVARGLKKAVKGARILELHGQMKSGDKEAVMATFASGGADILVSTTVVEVGVDVPNATVMAIMGAEHFGLAQLHQLRGRVGRSDLPSYCLLCPGELTQSGRDRLMAVQGTQDGFVLAEKDLELRGGGNLFGNAQSGFPDFQFATPSDTDIMKTARDWAERIISEDAELSAYPLMRTRVEEAFEQAHLE